MSEGAQPGCTVTICNRKVQVKRLFLPAAGAAGLTALSPTRTYVVFPVLIFWVAFIIFWNFPFIVTATNSRPVYYEEVFENETEHETDTQMKRRFEAACDWSLITTNSLFAAALAEYWLYQTGGTSSYTQILGITGGIMKVFQTLNHASGTVILGVTRYAVEREKKAAVQSQGITIEMSAAISDAEPDQGSEQPQSSQQQTKVVSV